MVVKGRKEKAAKKEKVVKKTEDGVGESIKLWNTFRAKSMDKEKRRSLIEKTLGGHLKGKLFETSLKHDGARVVQAMIRYGDAPQRAKIQSELVPRFVELAKVPYACHVAIALCRHAFEPQSFFAAVRGKFAKLGTHATAGPVADALLRHLAEHSAAGRSLKRKLLSEFFDQEHDTLEGAVAADPARGGRFVAGALRTAQRLVEKGLAQHLLAHEVFWEVARAADATQLAELASSSVEAAPHVAASRPGALSVCRLVGAADPKIRKKILKAFPKDAISHKFAHLVVWRAMACVDDTVFTNKQVDLSADVATHPVGGRVCVWLLRGHLALNQDEELALAGASTSKKPDETRRAELEANALAKLREACVDQPVAFLSSRAGAMVAAELVIHGCEDAAVALAKAAAVDFPVAAGCAIVDHDVAHASLKSILQKEAHKGGTIFGRAFFDLVKNDLAAWASSNRGAFILDALLAYHNNADFAVKTAATLKPLLQRRDDDAAWANTKGADALRKNRLILLHHQ